MTDEERRKIFIDCVSAAAGTYLQRKRRYNLHPNDEAKEIMRLILDAHTYSYSTFFDEEDILVVAMKFLKENC